MASNSDWLFDISVETTQAAKQVSTFVTETTKKLGSLKNVVISVDQNKVNSQVDNLIKRIDSRMAAIKPVAIKFDSATVTSSLNQLTSAINKAVGALGRLNGANASVVASNNRAAASARDHGDAMSFMSKVAGNTVFKFIEYEVVMASFNAIIHELTFSLKEAADVQLEQTLQRLYNPTVNLNKSLENSIIVARQWGADITDVQQAIGIWTKKLGNLEAATYLADQAEQLHRASGISTQEVTQKSIALAEQLGLKWKELPKVYDEVAQAALMVAIPMKALGKVGGRESMKEIFEGLSESAGTLKAFGFDTEGIIAVVTEMTEGLGKAGGTTGTQLSNMLAALEGGGKHRKAFQDIISDVKNTDDLLVKLTARAQELRQALAQGHTGVKTQQYEELTTLLSMLDNIRKARQKLINESKGKLNIIAEAEMATAIGQFDRLKTSVQIFSNTLGRQLLPAAQEVMQWLNSYLFPSITNGVPLLLRLADAAFKVGVAFLTLQVISRVSAFMAGTSAAAIALQVSLANVETVALGVANVMGGRVPYGLGLAAGGFRLLASSILTILGPIGLALIGIQTVMSAMDGLNRRKTFDLDVDIAFANPDNKVENLLRKAGNAGAIISSNLSRGLDKGIGGDNSPARALYNKDMIVARQDFANHKLSPDSYSAQLLHASHLAQTDTGEARDKDWDNVRTLLKTQHSVDTQKGYAQTKEQKDLMAMLEKSEAVRKALEARASEGTKGIPDYKNEPGKPKGMASEQSIFSKGVSEDKAASQANITMWVDRAAAMKENIATERELVKIDNDKAGHMKAIDQAFNLEIYDIGRAKKATEDEIVSLQKRVDAGKKLMDSHKDHKSTVWIDEQKAVELAKDAIIKATGAASKYGAELKLLAAERKRSLAEGIYDRDIDTFSSLAKQGMPTVSKVMTDAGAISFKNDYVGLSDFTDQLTRMKENVSGAHGELQKLAMNTANAATATTLLGKAMEFYQSHKGPWTSGDETKFQTFIYAIIKDINTFKDGARTASVAVTGLDAAIRDLITSSSAANAKSIASILGIDKSDMDYVDGMLAGYKKINDAIDHINTLQREYGPNITDSQRTQLDLARQQVKEEADLLPILERQKAIRASAMYQATESVLQKHGQQHIDASIDKLLPGKNEFSQMLNEWTKSVMNAWWKETAQHMTDSLFGNAEKTREEALKVAYQDHVKGMILAAEAMQRSANTMMAAAGKMPGSGIPDTLPPNFIPGYDTGGGIDGSPRTAQQIAAATRSTDQLAAQQGTYLATSELNNYFKTGTFASDFGSLFAVPGAGSTSSGNLTSMLPLLLSGGSGGGGKLGSLAMLLSMGAGMLGQFGGGAGGGRPTLNPDGTLSTGGSLAGSNMSQFAALLGKTGKGLGAAASVYGGIQQGGISGGIQSALGMDQLALLLGASGGLATPLAVAAGLFALLSHHDNPANMPDKYMPGYGNLVSDLNGAPGMFNGTSVGPSSQYDRSLGNKDEAQQLWDWLSNPGNLGQLSGSSLDAVNRLKALGGSNGDLGIVGEKNGMFTLGSGMTVKVDDYKTLIDQVTAIKDNTAKMALAPIFSANAYNMTPGSSPFGVYNTPGLDSASFKQMQAGWGTTGTSGTAAPLTGNGFVNGMPVTPGVGGLITAPVPPQYIMTVVNLDGQVLATAVNAVNSDKVDRRLVVA